MFGWQTRAARQLELDREIIEKMESLERRMKALELDWENMYDKLRSMVQRITKRAEVIEKSVTEPQEPTSSVSPDHTSGRLLTPRQMAIQQQILRRRANGGEA